MKNLKRGIVLPILLIPLHLIQSQKVRMEKPNIIFFMADDLGWTDLTCYGSKFYETPNLDQLAKEGVLFTNAYATCPVSSPTRASFQTGKYPARIGMTDWIKGRYESPSNKKKMQLVCPVLPATNIYNLPLEETTIAEVLSENGYKTAHIGKWHLALDSLYFPQFQGYDINVAGCSKGSPGAEGGSYFVPYNNPNLPDGPQGEYLTDRLGNECIKVMEQFKDHPFFISFPFYQVHTPLIGKPDKVVYFKEKAHRMGIDTLQNIFDENPSWKIALPFVEKEYHERLIQNNPVYAAMISSMDENVGKVIANLKRLGLYENTIIIFTSDNGGLSTAEGSPTSNKPLRAGKGHLYEGGIREPLIAKWYGHFPKGKVSSSLVTTADYFPTILDLLKISKPNKLKIDGVSIKSALDGGTNKRGAIYWHYPHYSNQGGRPGGAIRLGDYKLIEFYDNGDVELYNLKNDIGETNNLANLDKERVVTLSKKLSDWRISICAKMPMKNKNVNKKLIISKL